MSKLLVRLLESKDLTRLPDLYAEQEVYANTLQLPYPSPQQWQDMLTRPGHTSLVAMAGEDLLGHTGIDMGQRHRRRHVATFGIAVKQAARGQGVGTALVNAAVDVCDNWANITRIELQVYTDNHAAIALYKKSGFVIEGTHLQYALRDGAFVDAHFMARIKPFGRPGAHPQSRP